MNPTQARIEADAEALRQRNAAKQAKHRWTTPDYQKKHREYQRQNRAKKWADAKRVLAAAIAANLFTNGSGDRAFRLVLTSKEGRDLGGLAQGVVVDRIAEMLP